VGNPDSWRSSIWSKIISAIQAQNTVNPRENGGDGAQRPSLHTRFWRKAGWSRAVGQIVRETSDGGIVRVRDVARIELGTQDCWKFNGKQCRVAYQLPGSMQSAAAGVTKLMTQLKQRFPEDLDFAVALDTTRSVTEGIKEIVKTLLIALVLVILVVYLFLQGWRATLIPLLAVPVSLVGTFVLFPLFGFSINTLSLFGLVLAIGLVVDDAIVVVEGVARHIEDGLTPKDAALKAWNSRPGSWDYLVPPAVCAANASQASPDSWQFAVRLRSRSSRHRRFAPSAPGGACCDRASEPRATQRFFDWFNRVNQRYPWLRTLEWSAGSEDRCCTRVPCDIWPRSGVLCPSRAQQFSPRRRPGLCLCLSSTPQRSLAGTHKGGLG
jgi:HAE1 family hydrophobic/amphiphilic exporter-1